MSDGMQAVLTSSWSKISKTSAVVKHGEGTMRPSEGTLSSGNEVAGEAVLKTKTKYSLKILALSGWEVPSLEPLLMTAGAEWVLVLAQNRTRASWG